VLIGKISTSTVRTSANTNNLRKRKRRVTCPVVKNCGRKGAKALKTTVRTLKGSETF